jgi:transposase-like protein
MARWAWGPAGGRITERMKKISYAGYRFPPEIIRQAIWLYLRFPLSFGDVEDLLAERGLAVSYETVRRWVNHFGPMIAADLRKRRQKPHTTRHLDEVYLKIDGRMVYLGGPSTLRARFSMCWSSPRRAETDAQAPQEVCFCS